MAKMAIADQVLQRQDKDGMLRRALERIIQLYTDKSHFVYELLQNAEDCGASKIKFFQYEDRLEVVHDGRPFSLNNLQGLYFASSRLYSARFRQVDFTLQNWQ